MLEFYLVPAAVICLCIWLIMAALKNFGLGVWGRRLSFVALATAGLAPSAVPGGVIVVVYMPNGVLLAFGSLPMLHNEKLVHFALLSFLATAVVSFLLSLVLVRATKGGKRPDTKAHATGAVQLALLVAAFFVFKAFVPDREVAESIDWTLIESVYGERLDRAEALANIDDVMERNSEIAALREWVAAEPTIVSLRVSSELPGNLQDGEALVLGPPRRSRGCSSSGDGAWRNDRLMRCTSELEGRGKTATLSYERNSGIEGNRVYIEVEFDYKRLLKGADSSDTRLALSGSDELARRNDAALIGEWSITDRYERTVNEERSQKGVLFIGPRESFGTYAVRAEVEVESRLRTDESYFERPECRQAAEQCSYVEAVTGTLRIRGSKVQIVYGHPRWSTDILSLEGNTMLGRSNNWGTTTRFERLEAPK